MDYTILKTFYKDIKNSPINEIKNIIYNFIDKYSVFCDEYLGEGYFGKVTTPMFGPTIKVIYSKSEMNVCTAVKQAKYTEGQFRTHINKDAIFFISDRSMTSESIILFMISKLWFEKRSPHLPLLLGIDVCKTSDPYSISRIVIERHGAIPWHNGIRKQTIMKSNIIDNFCDQKGDIITDLSTVKSLLEYIQMYKYNDNLMIKLPNDQKVYLPDLIDYMYISFAHTDYILQKELGLTLSDQHAANIYIHWLSKKSYVGDRNISNLHTIYYQIGNNKYIKCNTYGILIKIGDVGTSVMVPRENVYIIGDSVMSNTMFTSSSMKKFNTPKPSYNDMFLNIITIMPIEVLLKTSVFKLFMKKPYSYTSFHPTQPNTIDSLKMLNDEVFKPYVTSLPSNLNDCFVVNF